MPFPVENRAPVRKVTLARVAKCAGVSASAASAWGNRLLYQPGGRPAVGLSHETRARLVAACRELGYEPADRQLWAQIYPERTDTCFLLDRSVAEGLANPYHGRIFNGVVEAMHAFSGQVIFGQVSENIDYLLGPDLLPKSLTEHQAGRVIISGNPNYSLLMRLIREGRPVAQLSQAVDVPGVLSIVPAYREAARLALGHLVGLGHRRIAIVAENYMNPARYNSRELRAGAEEVLREAGVGAHGDRIFYNPPHSAHGPGALAQLRDGPGLPTAVFCFNDHSGVRVIEEARQLGLSVPGQLSVMGCNDEFRDPALHRALSTVHFPLEEIGRTAVALLNRQIKDGPGTAPALTRLPIELRPRESTAAPTHPLHAASPR